MREKRRRRKKVKVVMYVSLPLLLTTNKVQVTRQSYKVSLVSSILTPPILLKLRRHHDDMHRYHRVHRHDNTTCTCVDHGLMRRVQGRRTNLLVGLMNCLVRSIASLYTHWGGLIVAYMLRLHQAGGIGQCADLQSCPRTRSIKP